MWEDLVSSLAIVVILSNDVKAIIVYIVDA